MTVWEACIRIFAAVVVGTVIGVERERKNRPAGMRTHVLVCLGACMVALMECFLARDMRALGGDAGNTAYTIGRISAQVVSGVGFLGAGTIFTARKKIAGLTTAASLWNAACLGLAIGFGYYLIAAIGCVIVIVVLEMLQKIVHVNVIKKVEVRFIHRVETIDFINEYFAAQQIKVLDIDFHVESHESNNVYTNIYELRLPDAVSYTDIVNHLSEHANIQAVRTTNV